MASLRILVVDDDDLSRDLIVLLLSAEGHRVVKTESGPAALHLLATSDQTSMPQVVLTDMQMPGMTGEELCRNIRKCWDRLRGPLPLLIGMSATEATEEQLQEFDAFVGKPLETQSFQKLLAERFSRPPVLKDEFLPPSADTDALDAGVVDKLRKLMPAAALDELFTTYLNDTRERLKHMEAYAAAGDFAEVRRCAHMMKGSAAMTGASGIRRVAALLETTDIPFEQQRALFHELRCACDAIEGTLARDARNKEAHDHQTT